MGWTANCLARDATSFSGGPGRAGAPDLVLCGTDTTHLGAAFATHGLGSFETLMQEASHGSP